MALFERERSFFLELEATAKRLSVASTSTESEALRGLFNEIKTNSGGSSDSNRTDAIDVQLSYERSE